MGEGTGLGLSMIYGFVRQSGGSVRVQSRIGVGTRMTLFLPRATVMASVAEAGESSTLPALTSRNEQVLVIDDEPTVRMLVTEVLEDLGYTTLQAADGAGGLAILQSDRRIDLLVTDVGLPGGINGRQVADAGRSLRPGLKVLFITGYVQDAKAWEDQLESGMHLLTKPFAMAALAGRIEQLLSGPG